jgi:hypothetical protein
MASERILNNSQFFSEVHKDGFSSPVRIMTEQALGALVGMKARVHLHSPATEKLGRPIYSVLVNGRVEGHTEDIYLKDTQMKVDKRQLQAWRDNPTGGKTRNTFVAGTVHPVPYEPASETLHVLPGSMTDKNTGEDVSMGMAGTRLTANEKGKPVAKYKPIG